MEFSIVSEIENSKLRKDTLSDIVRRTSRQSEIRDKNCEIF